MSEREQIDILLDSTPQYKLGLVLAFLQGLSLSDYTPDEPNNITVAAFEEGEKMLHDPNAKRFSSVDDLFAELNA